MAKGYWIAFYRSVSNPAALAEYAKLATPAIQAGGGRFIARGTPYRRYEAGLDQRTVVIEFVRTVMMYRRGCVPAQVRPQPNEAASR